MCSTSEYKTDYYQAAENDCGFCSARAGSTDSLRGQQAKRVSCNAWLTQKIERPPDSRLHYSSGSLLEHLYKSTTFSSQPDPVFAPFNSLHHCADPYPGRLQPEVPKYRKTIDFFVIIYAVL
jgi:hypothetical protein